MDAGKMSIKQLKAALQARGVATLHMLERSELVTALARAPPPPPEDLPRTLQQAGRALVGSDVSAALVAAVLLGRTGSVPTLLAQGADPSRLFDGQYAPMAAAIGHELMHQVAPLLRVDRTPKLDRTEGAKRLLVLLNRCTALHAAAHVNDLEALMAMLRSPRALVNLPSPADGWTPLHCAAAEGHAEAAAALLRAGASPRCKSFNNETPFQLARHGGGVSCGGDEALPAPRLKLLRLLHEHVGGAAEAALEYTYASPALMGASEQLDHAAVGAAAGVRLTAVFAEPEVDAARGGCCNCGAHCSVGMLAAEARQHALKHLMLCGRCARASYCSRDCQKAAWRVHKKVCEARQQEGAPSRRISGYTVEPLPLAHTADGGRPEISCGIPGLAIQIEYLGLAPTDEEKAAAVRQFHALALAGFNPACPAFGGSGPSDIRSMRML